MLIEQIQPSTLRGIKRHAKQLKKVNGIPYHEALNIAAQKASFQNFTHARNYLDTLSTVSDEHQLFLVVYWCEPRSSQSGREVLEVKLNKPLSQIVSKSELKKVGDLGAFRTALPDLLVDDYVALSQEEARNRICKSVRKLRFMEATGLKPCNDNDAGYPNRESNNRLPKSDHGSLWSDPNSQQCILVDEPYLNADYDDERSSWAKTHNWHLQRTKWAGMYYPGQSSMYISTDASTDYDFKGLVAKVDALPYPITLENWNGLSTTGLDIFFSPLTLTAQDKKRAVAKGTIYRVPTSKTLPMKNWNAPDNERRPNASMKIETHKVVARMIKAVQHSQVTPYEVSSLLSLVKSKLEDWFFAEHDRNVTDKYDLFYYSEIDENDPFVIQANTTNGVLELLGNIKKILLTDYVDCKPLRALVGKIDTSIKLVTKLD